MLKDNKKNSTKIVSIFKCIQKDHEFCCWALIQLKLYFLKFLTHVLKPVCKVKFFALRLDTDKIFV